MLYEVSYVTITIALLITYFVLLRKSNQPEYGSQLEPKHVEINNVRNTSNIIINSVVFEYIRFIFYNEIWYRDVYFMQLIQQNDKYRVNKKHLLILSKK